MPQHSLNSDELLLIEDALNSESKAINIRLREGEYQFNLAKAIASFECELHFPDVRDLTMKLYGESRADDIQFIRKIQTILKKMEKSGIIRILPKKQPWELQRYALSSFKFLDVEKNRIALVSEEEARKATDVIRTSATAVKTVRRKPNHRTARIALLTTITILSYAAVVWTFVQPSMDPIAFVTAFSIAAISSTFLGIALAKNTEIGRKV